MLSSHLGPGARWQSSLWIKQAFSWSSWAPLASLALFEFSTSSNPILLLCREVKTKDQRGEGSRPRSHSKLEVVLAERGLTTQASFFPSSQREQVRLRFPLAPRLEALVQWTCTSLCYGPAAPALIKLCRLKMFSNQVVMMVVQV